MFLWKEHQVTRGHLSCYMANGDTLAAAEGRSPPDTDWNSNSHSSALHAKHGAHPSRYRIPEHWLRLYPRGAWERSEYWNELWSSHRSVLRPFVPSSLISHPLLSLLHMLQRALAFPLSWGSSGFFQGITQDWPMKCWQSDFGWLSLMLAT